MAGMLMRAEITINLASLRVRITAYFKQAIWSSITIKAHHGCVYMTITITISTAPILISQAFSAVGLPGSFWRLSSCTKGETIWGLDHSFSLSGYNLTMKLRHVLPCHCFNKMDQTKSHCIKSNIKASHGNMIPAHCLICVI